MRRVFRPQGAADFLDIGLSTLEKARRLDPDFADCRAIKLGTRAIGFDFEDLLRVYLRKVCRRDGVKPEHLEAEVERRLIEEHARAELIAEARARLEAKTKTNRKSSKQLEAV